MFTPLTFIIACICVGFGLLIYEVFFNNNNDDFNGGLGQLA